MSIRRLVVAIALVFAPSVVVRGDDSEGKPSIKIAAAKLLREVIADPKAAAARYQGKVSLSTARYPQSPVLIRRTPWS